MTLLSGSSAADVDAGVGAAGRWWRTSSGGRSGSTGWSASVVERDDQGRPLVCDTVADAKITKVRCRVRVSYDQPHHLSFSRVESDDVDEMEGSWDLQEAGEGALTPSTSSPSIPGT